MRLRSKRAVSTIVATIIMVNIAVVLGVTAYLYQQNMLGVMIGNYEIYVDRNKAMMQERISITNIRYNSSDTTEYNLNLTILNSGSKEVWIAAMYLNNTDIMDAIYKDASNKFQVWNNTGDFEHHQPNPKGEYLVVVGDSLTFTFEKSLLSSYLSEEITYGYLQSFIVVTVDGVKTQQEWLATRGV